MFNSDLIIGLPIEQAEKLLREDGVDYSIKKIDTNSEADAYLVVRVDENFNIICQGFKLKV